MVDFDAIVVGSGAGGGILARELASRGQRVLLLERGQAIDDRRLHRDERAMFEQRIASDDRAFRVNGRASRPLVGGLPGGSTALFGGVLLRPSPHDFVPHAFYGTRVPAAVAEWPIAYAELEPYFGRAEDLFGVAGAAEQRVPHLGRRRQPYKARLPELAPINQELAHGLAAQGLAPFRLPLAIDFDRCRGCASCPGMLCPYDARATALSGAIESRPESGLELWEGCEAERLEHRRGRVVAVHVLDRRSGRRTQVTADRFISSGGAIGSPVLLLRSGIPDPSGQLGRNHMCHLGAIVVAGFARSVGAHERFVKQLGISDYYLGSRTVREKLGVVQQIPIPGPRSLARQLRLPLPRGAAEFIRARALVFAGTVEDLPQPDNRVSFSAADGIRLRRRFHRFDVLRARGLARDLARALRQAGAPVAFAHVAARAHDHLAHQVGTCRFGSNPRTSVLDPTCRVHGMENLYVVDGSFLPTSLGVGPALTIAANALRVADHLLDVQEAA